MFWLGDVCKPIAKPLHQSSHLQMSLLHKIPFLRKAQSDTKLSAQTSVLDTCRDGILSYSASVLDTCGDRTLSYSTSVLNTCGKKANQDIKASIIIMDSSYLIIYIDNGIVMESSPYHDGELLSTN